MLPFPLRYGHGLHACTLREGGILVACTTLYLSISVLAALQNVTVDGHEYSRITYTNPGDWNHSRRALIGWEYLFYNGTRSYAYVPGV
jgi:hypothetical protein